MLITKRSLPRRTVLRGIGATLALPLLDAMVPALSALSGTVANPVRRLGFIYFPNGANMLQWMCQGEGNRFELSRTLFPLEPFREAITELSGLDNAPANALGDGNGDHPRAGAAWLNATHPRKSEGANVRAGTTIDQIAAAEFGKHTPLGSLELCLEPAGWLGTCGGSGYSCAYTDTIAWRTPTTPLPMEYNPRNVFSRMFGDGTTAEARDAQRKINRSVLDSVTKEIAGLQRRIGPGDRIRLTEYLDAVREVERRIERTEAQSATMPSVNQPTGVPDTTEEHCKLMYDLQVLAYQADVTRIVTFQLGRETSQRTFPEIGVPDPHHTTSHHQNDQVRGERIAKIDTFLVDQFAYFLGKLRDTPDGDGSLLDHVMILYGGGMSDGNLHIHESLPLVVAGHGGGQIGGGRHLQYPAGTPHANLLMTLLHMAGVPVESVGDSTGPLEGLT
jgi:hypothetical protein